MPSHPLNNLDIQEYYQDEPTFGGVYSRDNLPKRSSTEIKDEAYVINLDECSDIVTHWIVFYVQNIDVTCFDSFGREHIPKEIKKFVRNRSIKINIFQIQTYDSIMCGYFFIEFIDFILARKTLTGFTNLFSTNNFKK